MSRWTPEAKVGIITIIAIIAGLYFLSNLRLFKGDIGEYYQVTVYFNNVTGLLNNADVRLNGIRVGRVSDIQLIPGNAVVTLDIISDAEVRRNDHISLATLGVMGEKYIDIMPGDRTYPLVRDADVPMEGHDSIGLEELGVSFNVVLKSFQHITQNMQEVTQSFSDVLGSQDGRDKLGDILVNTRDITGNISYLTSKEHEELAGIIKNINEITEALAGTLPELIKKVDQMAGISYEMMERDKENISDIVNNIEKITSNLTLVSESVVASTHNFEMVSNTISSGEGSVGKLLMEDETIDNVNKALESLHEIAEEVQSYLVQASRLETFVGYDTEYNTRVERFKGYVNFKIVPSDEVYYLVQLVNDPYGLETYTTRVMTIEGPDGDTTYTHHEKKIENVLRFSLLYGRRVANFIFLKAGLMESYAGVGADVMFFRDKFSFSVDAWDFSNQEYDPHYKVMLSYMPNQNMYFRVGYDDFANPERRSMVFGAGIHFSDEHLRSLLGLLSLGAFAN